MYGTQAEKRLEIYTYLFENDVKMYGTQASTKELFKRYSFENDVKMYGTQARRLLECSRLSLRMM